MFHTVTKTLVLVVVSLMALTASLLSESPAGTQSSSSSITEKDLGIPSPGGSSAKTFAPIDAVIAPLTLPPKDPDAWSFTLEPYLWAIGMQGKIGVKGEPPSEVSYSSKKILQSLDWGVFARAEIRRGKWGLLGDGFFAQLSASGPSPNEIYRNIDTTVQQGMASLAVAYRVIEDRRWFLDVYAGARYNYFGFNAVGELDSSVLQSVGEGATERIAAGVRTRVEDAVQSELDKFRSNQRAPRLPERLANRLRQALAARLKARAAPEIARAEANIASAKKKLAKAIARELTDRLPPESDGSQWWVDPIVGLRGQINFTRWLYLAAQGDVGGFGAGSQIAWNAQATVGINFTRNIFGELGYRYFFMDYDRNGGVYDAAEFGIFSSLGVKF